MKTLLHIGSFENKNTGGATLLIETGESYCLLSCLGEDNRTIQAVKIVTFENTALEESMRQILEEVERNGQKFKKVIVSPAYPQTLLVPDQFSDKGSSLLEITYNWQEAHQMQDKVSECQLTNCYMVPQPVYDTIISHYPSAVFVQAYTPSLKVPAGYDSENQVAVHFIHNVFRVMVTKKRALHLVQTYSYTASTDVLYYLLKIFREFSLPPNETPVILSGWIEEDSALYKELNSYFLQLRFAKAKAPGLSFAGNDLPEHYFVSLYNLSLCVS